MVVIRLARTGKKNSPSYRVTVADKDSCLSGKFLEQLGYYNPMQKVPFALNKERYDHWVKLGAQPSTRVHKLVADMGKDTKALKAKKMSKNEARRAKAKAAKAPEGGETPAAQ